VIIADTNLVAYLLIDGERTEAARRVRQRDPDWRLPTLWRSEFLNVLATTVRAGVLDEDSARSAWRTSLSLFGGCEEEPDAEAVLTVAFRARISAYDAQFVVLAKRHGVRLVTGDHGLLRHCPDVALSLEDFAAETLPP